MRIRHLQLVHDRQEHTTGSVGALTVAFATGDQRHVDQHFGLASTFARYSISLNGWKLLGLSAITETAETSAGDRITPRVAALEGCIALYCNAIGGPAVRRLLQARIQPRKVAAGTPIEAVLEELRSQLAAEQPPAWLARAQRSQRDLERHLDALEAEGWTGGY